MSEEELYEQDDSQETKKKSAPKNILQKIKTKGSSVASHIKAGIDSKIEKNP